MQKYHPNRALTAGGQAMKVSPVDYDCGCKLGLTWWWPQTWGHQWQSFHKGILTPLMAHLDSFYLVRQADVPLGIDNLEVWMKPTTYPTSLKRTKTVEYLSSLFAVRSCLEAQNVEALATSWIGWTSLFLKTKKGVHIVGPCGTIFGLSQAMNEGNMIYTSHPRSDMRYCEYWLDKWAALCTHSIERKAKHVNRNEARTNINLCEHVTMMNKSSTIIKQCHNNN